MEEHEGERINNVRVREAVEALHAAPAAASTICVACPYCMTMFEDGLKDTGAADVRVKDVAEIVAEGLRPV
jgi:Fe-S oxidoreductase